MIIERIIVGSLLALPALGLLALSLVLLRSASTGKGVERPGPEWDLRYHAWFWGRGIVGVAFVGGGLAIVIGMVHSFL